MHSLEDENQPTFDFEPLDEVEGKLMLHCLGQLEGQDSSDLPSTILRPFLRSIPVKEIQCTSDTLFIGEITPLSSSYNISGLVPVCWLLFQCF